MCQHFALQRDHSSERLGLSRCFDCARQADVFFPCLAKHQLQASHDISCVCKPASRTRRRCVRFLFSMSIACACHAAHFTDWRLSFAMNSTANINQHNRTFSGNGSVFPQQFYMGHMEKRDVDASQSSWYHIMSVDANTNLPDETSDRLTDMLAIGIPVKSVTSVSRETSATAIIVQILSVSGGLTAVFALARQWLGKMACMRKRRADEQCECCASRSANANESELQLQLHGRALRILDSYGELEKDARSADLDCDAVNS